MCNGFNGGLLRPLICVVRDRSERCPRSIGIRTLASDATIARALKDAPFLLAG
jgi:hypothetical protein